MTGISCLGCLGMGQALGESYIESQAVCGVYGTYTDTVTGNVYQMNGGCTDPQTASQVVAPTSNTTNVSTFLSSFSLTDWWNSLSQDEQVMVVAGIGLVGWYGYSGMEQHSRRGRFS